MGGEFTDEILKSGGRGAFSKSQKGVKGCFRVLTAEIKKGGVKFRVSHAYLYWRYTKNPKYSAGGWDRWGGHIMKKKRKRKKKPWGGARRDLDSRDSWGGMH